MTTPELEPRAARAPDFLCIGAQKSGTTWLHQHLRAHPSIWLPPIKELQYFNQIHIPGHVNWTERHRRELAQKRIDGHRRRRGDHPDHELLRLLEKLAAPVVDDAWYLSVFAQAPAGALCGEMTPEYSLLPDPGIAHLLALSPDVNILFLARDPIDRAWSQIRMHMQRAPGSDPLAIAASADVAERSDYPAILRRWRTRFDPSRILVRSLDAIVADPAAVLSSVCAFLELPFDPRRFPHLGAPVHQGIEAEMPDAVRAFLLARLEPVYDEVAEEFPDEAARWRSRHFR